MKYTIIRTKRYLKALRKVAHGGKLNREKLDLLVDTLAAGVNLPYNNHDHQLHGPMADMRECHIAPDILLLYKIEKEVLILVLIDIGSHSDIFR